MNQHIETLERLMRRTHPANVAALRAAIALMRGQSEPVACAHENTDTHYDCVTCRDCGGFRTDSGWGIASRRWFASRDEASFYQKNGRLPSKTEGPSR